ncbi:glycoside hydrolase family 3 N-terminal domain-containing protein [Ferruginibacter paludis]|uniref:glycoside hydrolase family 3 protein n=1 Tax=Ferruginibacter paludis TaxID=1310417 RepID=UPI0025B34112|nr:glycoside hydrolase family 3 N-terminal domain-containing protein [Ferruginibacter paludis]MDN3656014.1 glycoside hydrolase family 3 N-terminal domain-containing protein [Ferruginibacter paludis]
MKKSTICFAAICLLQTSRLQAQQWSEKINGTISTVTNPKGQTLGYSTTSGVKLITVNGLAFKDLNKNGKLDLYEDWRLPVAFRAKDLAAQMTIEQIAGLMLYSRHQPIPSPAKGVFAGTYNGKPFPESGAAASDLTDQQKDFLTKDNVRHVLVTSVQSPEVAVQWNNNVQALTEGIGLGIPANNSSDPRHGTVANAEFNAGAGGAISMWPGSLGLAATFDPAVVKNFGHIAALEYRAMGIATALSPQVDMATEPRWNRFSGTFGEHPKLAADMARAYIDGFQTSFGDKEINSGWGYNSVNAMVKHWPGGGSGEGGRDAHYGFGKYAVYPGNNFSQHFTPFTEGAFKLNGKTAKASAVMPYYTISVNQDSKNHDNVANNYNSYIITDLLRKKYHYDGVVCTDWLVTGDEAAVDLFITGKSWGTEKLSVAQRHYKILMAGVDQFGGNNDAVPVIDAYNMGVKEHGEAFMRARFEASAVRLLTNIFHTGLFENPYLDVEASKNTVGNAAFMKAGYNAQLKSMVLLKNSNKVLPLQKQKTVYVPKKFTPAGRNFLGMETPEKLDYPVNMNIVKKYFNTIDNPEEADYALVFIASPNSGNGYNSEDVKAGGNGYLPISLQYGEYKATDARAVSLAGGDQFENFTNRSYKDKNIKAINFTDLAMVNDTYVKMKGKPVIVSVNVSNPMVFAEFEKNASAILINFGVQDQAILDILTGKAVPAGLLPMQMPANMQTVEKQKEDVPLDMQCYKDAAGHVYDFGFGMNFNGVIKDARTLKYTKK